MIRRAAWANSDASQRQRHTDSAVPASQNPLHAGNREAPSQRWNTSAGNLTTRIDLTTVTWSHIWAEVKGEGIRRTIGAISIRTKYALEYGGSSKKQERGAAAGSRCDPRGLVLALFGDVDLTTEFGTRWRQALLILGQSWPLCRARWACWAIVRPTGGGSAQCRQNGGRV